MKIMILVVSFVSAAIGRGAPSVAAEVMLGPDMIPPHYRLGANRCSPGRGYSFSAEAPNHPSTYPKLNLRVFNGEVIGVVFEVPAKEGWKPWYDQAEGKPTAHDGTHEHYTQTIYFKKGPTAEQCNQAKNPFGK